jgi:ADP-ribosylation factor related protein 1
LAKDGRFSVCLRLLPHFATLYGLSGASTLDSVLSSPQILNVPLLLLANKQDSPMSLSVEEIRHDYEDWHQRKLESARRDARYGEADNETSARRERIASLDVMGISALEG